MIRFEALLVLTALLSVGALVAGFFWGLRVGREARAAPERQRAVRVLVACSVAVAGYMICYLFNWSTRWLRPHHELRAVAQTIILAAKLFMFAALATHLVRIVREPRTLWAAVLSSLCLIAGYVIHVMLARLGISSIQQDHPDALVEYLTSATLFAFLAMAPASLLAVLARQRMDREIIAKREG